MDENVKQELERLRAENAALKAKVPAKKTENGLKVSEKRALSIYGMGKWPVTLYKEQWKKLLIERREEILSFIEANDDKLANKGDVQPELPVE